VGQYYITITRKPISLDNDMAVEARIDSDDLVQIENLIKQAIKRLENDNNTST
jgi:hypothetical protein